MKTEREMVVLYRSFHGRRYDMVYRPKNRLCQTSQPWTLTPQTP
jgi:hypothetical protein